MSRQDPPIAGVDVLAARVYRVDGPGGSRLLRIAVSFPIKTADGRCECRAEVSDEDECIVRPMSGVDAIEALLLALINIGTELHAMTDGCDKLTWLAGREAGLRFPTFPEFSLRAVFESEISSSGDHA